MSSILIKGMEMPKHSGKHKIAEGYTVRIRVETDGHVEAYERRNYNNHDVVEVPTPHGDLIDKDMLLNFFSAKNLSKEDILMMAAEPVVLKMTLKIAETVKQYINELPTIIEAVE